MKQRTPRPETDHRIIGWKKKGLRCVCGWAPAVMHETRGAVVDLLEAHIDAAAPVPAPYGTTPSGPRPLDTNPETTAAHIIGYLVVERSPLSTHLQYTGVHCSCGWSRTHATDTQIADHLGTGTTPPAAKDLPARERDAHDLVDQLHQHLTGFGVDVCTCGHQLDSGGSPHGDGATTFVRHLAERRRDAMRQLLVTIHQEQR